MIKLKYWCNFTTKILSFRYASQFKSPQLISIVPNDGLTEFRELLLNNSYLSDEDMKSIRKSIIERFRHINEINVDAVIVGLCKTSDHLKIAKKYIEFLENEGIQANNATWGRLLKIYYDAYRNNTLTELDAKHILNIFDNITSKHSVLDPKTCECLILGIVATDQWKKAFDLIEMIKLTSVPSTNSHSAVLSRCFQDSENYSIGWNLLADCVVKHKKQPRCEVFIEYFESIRKNKENFRENLEKMLDFIGTNQLIISKTVIESLENILAEFNIKSSLVSLTKHGKCNSCGTFLERISITNKEFKMLKSSFLDKVLIRKDIFLKSSPKEFDEFVKFLNANEPFHCVIDGLNVAYSCGIQKNDRAYAKLVSSVVRYFAPRKNNILVLGRKHMNKWPVTEMDFIKKNSKLFLTNNLSQDDPFILYAALKSGPATDFFSRDLMRSHSHLLGTELKPIFNKWQQEHQYSLISANKRNGEIIVKEPVKYNCNAHKISGNWHIPFEEIHLLNPENIKLSNSWLCFSLYK